MKNALFRVICSVDNGCNWKRYAMFVFAPTQTQAKITVLRYWDSQYDTTATIESTRIIDDSAEGIVCEKEIGFGGRHVSSI